MAECATIDAERAMHAATFTSHQYGGFRMGYL